MPTMAMIIVFPAPDKKEAPYCWSRYWIRPQKVSGSIVFISYLTYVHVCSEFFTHIFLLNSYPDMYFILYVSQVEQFHHSDSGCTEIASSIISV